jgi:Helix-turn-helix domain
MTPMAALRRIRLEAARAALADGPTAIGAIAAAYRFTNPGRFARLFKEVLGQSPSELRRAQDRPKGRTAADDCRTPNRLIEAQRSDASVSDPNCPAADNCVFCLSDSLCVSLRRPRDESMSLPKNGGAVGPAGKKRSVFIGRSFDVDYLHVRRKNNDLARGNSFIQGSGLLELRRATQCE